MQMHELTSTQLWLQEWDTHRSVWSVSMGGLGPGYEQVIQIIAAEIMRYLLDNPVDYARAEARDAEYNKQVSNAVDEHLRNLGLFGQLSPSGAQVGAAMNLAFVMTRHTPAKAYAMVDEERHIQVSKDFPSWSNKGSTA